MLALVLPGPPEGGGGQGIQGDAGSQGESSAYVIGLATASSSKSSPLVATYADARVALHIRSSD